MNAVRDFDDDMDGARAEREQERDERLAEEFGANVRSMLPRTRSDDRVEHLRVPPHSIETEQAVLGGLMLDSDALDRIAGKLAPEDFFRRDHQLIFRAIGELAKAGSPFDAITLGDWFVDQGLSEQVAGGAYLVELASNTPGAANIVAYAEIVRDHANKRRLIDVGTQIVNNGFQPNGRETPELLAEALQALQQVEAFAPSAYQPKRLQFLPTGDLLRNIAPPDWAIDGIAELDSFTVLYGDPGSGKSFMAIDWACCVACGENWNGRQVQQGPVLYLNGEGHNGVGRRLRAWAIRHNLPLQKHPFFISTVTTALTDLEARTELLRVVQAFTEEHGKPVMVVVDTLARNFGPGDENSTQDMGNAVTTLDALRQQTGAWVLAVHHSGHGDKDRARGSTVLLGSADTEYRLSRLADEETGKPLEETLLECTKIKDGTAPAPTSFRFADVGIGIFDKQGEEVVSAILDPSHNPNPVKAWQVKHKAAKGNSNGRPNVNRDKALEVLQGLYAFARANMVKQGRSPASAIVSFKDWRAALCEAGIARQNTYRCVDALIAEGIVVKDGPHAVMVEPAQETDPFKGESW